MLIGHHGTAQKRSASFDEVYQQIESDYSDLWEVDLDKMDLAMELCPDLSDYPLLLFIKGEVLLNDDMPAVAMLYFEQAVKFAKEKDDLFLLSRSQFSLANALFLLNELDKANQAAGEALDLLSKNPDIQDAENLELVNKLMLIEGLHKKGETQRAVDMAWKLYDRYKQMDYSIEILGMLYVISEETDNSNLLEKIITTYDRDHLNRHEDDFYDFHYHLAQTTKRIKDKDFKSSLIYNDSAIEIINREYLLTEKEAAFNNYITIYSNLNQPDMVSNYQDSLDLFLNIRDSIYDRNVLMQINKMQEFQELEIEQGNTRLFTIITALIAIIFVVFTLLRKRYKAQIASKENLENKLTKEKSVLLQDNINLSESNRKKQELLKGALTKIATSPKTDTDRDILTEIRLALSQDNYESVTANEAKLNFAVYAKERLPALTKTEVDICFYLKTGLSTSEIAKALSRSTRSIESYRYRIRKKITENTGGSLEKFLR